MTAWPDWRGETAIVIASGPSLKKQDVELCRGRGKVIAIKKCVELAPFADVVYGCDGPWWRSVVGLMKFQGLKLAYEATVCGSEWGIRKVNIPDDPKVKGEKIHRMLFDETGTIGSGGNSGFQAVNLAAQFGAAAIVLLGFDFGGETASHWYGRNNWMQANNPDQWSYDKWKRRMEAAAPDLKARGIEVINASRQTSLTCFRRASIEEALEISRQAA